MMHRALLLLLLVAAASRARIHHLAIHGDKRKSVPLSTFGFYAGGRLSVNMSGFLAPDDGGQEAAAATVVGFSIDKTVSDALNPYVETSDVDCILTRRLEDQETAGILRFTLDLRQMRTVVRCSSNIQSIVIKEWRRPDSKEGSALSDSSIFRPFRKRKAAAEQDRAAATGGNATQFKVEPAVPDKEMADNESIEGREEKHRFIPADSDPSADSEDVCSRLNIPIKKYTIADKTFYQTSFYILINGEEEEGLYSMYFHNCYNFNKNNQRQRIPVDFDIKIEEKNNDNYLSAGEIPLPALYEMLAVLFFLSGCFWVFILRKNGAEQVYRIHWIMGALVFLKALSLLFHGINYNKIATNGRHIETWAVLYYITHLLKGGLLFFTIVLIGSGWAFIKHILSSNEKKVFMFVLPLQVLANVAYIIVEESEEGEANHNFWKEAFILIDLVCCGAILLPVVWSIRHLQDASSTDGKAAVSLEKLKLFRHFYIMVVCYVYFTRIIVYLLRITVPFQYEWLDDMFKEMATFVFFVMTGYKFRPASNNPYFAVPTSDDEMEEVLVGSTALREQVKSRKPRSAAAANSANDYEDDDDDNDDDTVVLFDKSEMSHDLD